VEAARPATPDDLAVLVHLAGVARHELGPMRGGSVFLRREARRDDVHELAALLTDPAAAAWIGTIDEVPVGYAVARVVTLHDDGRLAVIDDLFVEPEARGVGVGEALMDMVVTWAEAAGCVGVDAVALPGNRDAKNFFERFGLTARAIVVHRALGPPTAGPRP
jgi:GNAT superfamily N-acetyltransferase